MRIYEQHNKTSGLEGESHGERPQALTPSQASGQSAAQADVSHSPQDFTQRFTQDITQSLTQSLTRGSSLTSQHLFDDGKQRRVNDSDIEQVNQHFDAAMGRLFRNASEGSALHKLGTALSLLQMLDSQHLGDDKNQSLEDYDREARGILGMRRSALQVRVAELLQTPQIQREFERAREGALRKTFGSDYHKVPQEYANYILSGDFYEGLQALPPQQQQERLSAEILRLTALDPELAQQTAVHYAAAEMQRNPLGIFERLPQDVQRQALDKILQLKAQELGSGSELGQILAQDSRRAAVVDLLHGLLQTPCFLNAAPSERGEILKAELARRGGDLRGAEDLGRLLDDLGAQGDLNEALSSLLTGVVLAGSTESFLPENDGVITWHARRAASITTNTLGTVSSIPDIAKFINADLKISKAARAVASASRAVQGLGAAGKFVKVCQWLGPIGDAISLPFDITASVYESENEDDVGMYSSIAASGAGIMGVTGGVATALGSTGVGIPLAIGAVIVGLGATAINALFGESSLTGQVRQDLRYVGVLDAEEELAEQRTTATYRIEGFFGESYTTRYERPLEEIRAESKEASILEKVQLINYYLDQDTNSSEESLVYGILKDTPYQDNAFLHLMEALDTGSLASELESRQQVRQVMKWTLEANQRAGQAPGEPLNAMLRQLAYEHREESLRDFLEDISDAQYAQLDATVIREMSLKLMDGQTDDAEERVIYNLLKRSSPEQLAEVIMEAPAGFVSDLKSELESWQFNRLRERMKQSPNAGVRYYATRY